MARAILTLFPALLLTLASGCLTHAAGPVSTAAAADTGAAASATAAADPPRCPPNDASNYGTWTQVGDLYIVSPYEGNLLVVYKESNGCPSLQSQGGWPQNPDTKVAEIPYPIAAKA